MVSPCQDAGALEGRTGPGRRTTGTGRAMRRYSIFQLARNALTRHENWWEAWRSPEPQPAYDAVIVGGGGHGLATAYYLAKEHGWTRIALLEKGWLGGGNTGRNTTIIRSNYLFDASAGLYEHALKLWEGLSQELNYNIMFQPARRDETWRMTSTRPATSGAGPMPTASTASMPNGSTGRRRWPSARLLNPDPTIRYPVYGSTLQRRAGTARHDAVAWGYARAADATASTSSSNAR